MQVSDILINIIVENKIGATENNGAYVKHNVFLLLAPKDKVVPVRRWFFCYD